MYSFVCALSRQSKPWQAGIVAMKPTQSTSDGTPKTTNQKMAKRATQSRWSPAVCEYSSHSTSPAVADTNRWKPLSNIEQSPQWSKRMASRLEGAQACK